MREARVIHPPINKACFIISQNKNVYAKRLLRRLTLLIATEVLGDAPSNSANLAFEGGRGLLIASAACRKTFSAAAEIFAECRKYC